MKGSYVLLLEIPRSCHINVGSLRNIDFPCGWYAYVGSAMNGIEQRIKRHLRSNKKYHWHVDYFINKAKLKAVFYHESIENKEESIVMYLEKMGFDSIKGFGASDSNRESHLFYNENKNILISAILSFGMKDMLIAYV